MIIGYLSEDMKGKHKLEDRQTRENNNKININRIGF
jgi:hypothetical protein